MAALRTAVRGVRYLPRSEARRCGCCDRRSLILHFGHWGEYQRCVWCRANERYELLGGYLRTLDVAGMDVLELDRDSPLRGLLVGGRTYTRSYFSAAAPPGETATPGVRCEDITNLTLEDESLDLIVSSEVLEHVPDFQGALRESCRVLRPGGRHVFTVPPATVTRQRARLVDGEVQHLVEPPETHPDPLDPAGILVFWEVGFDAPAVFADTGLALSVVAGPVAGGRAVWAASRRER